MFSLLTSVMGVSSGRMLAFTYHIAFMYLRAYLMLLCEHIFSFIPLELVHRLWFGKPGYIIDVLLNFPIFRLKKYMYYEIRVNEVTS